MPRCTPHAAASRSRQGVSTRSAAGEAPLKSTGAAPSGFLSAAAVRKATRRAPMLQGLGGQLGGCEFRL